MKYCYGFTTEKKKAQKYIYNLNITLLIKLLLLCFGSDKFGERTNLSNKPSE